MRLRQVEVVWHDAVTFGEPFKLDEVKDKALLSVRHTMGYLVYQDAERVVIAQTRDPEDDEVDDVTVIPAPWVIRRARKRRKRA